jgi:DNA-binding MarR family transcriptional regulator
MTLAQADFERLLELRTGLRRLLRWSERRAREAGLTPAQHQLLLAIRGHPDSAGPTIGDVAEYLVLRHNSAVELVDRAATAGLVQRTPDRRNRAAVRLTLTETGLGKLDALTETHVAELAHLAPTMRALWTAIEHSAQESPQLEGVAARGGLPG